MNEENGMPIIPGVEPTEADEQLVRFFDKLELQQLELLDGAAKRLLELVTAMLGLVFAAIAFGADFPPVYVSAGPIGPALLLILLIFYLLAMYFAWDCLRPLSYARFRHNLTGMREELDKMAQHKTRALRRAGRLFWMASIVLVALTLYAVIQ